MSKNEEVFLAYDRARTQLEVNALDAVTKMDLPKTVEISDDSFSGLGLKTSRIACRELRLLRETHGDKLPYLIGLALREIWFALFMASGHEALSIAEGIREDNDQNQKLATAEGYAEEEGFATELFSYLTARTISKRVTFRNETPFEGCVPSYDILSGASLYWFAAAATAYHAGNVDGALDWLSEAQEALLWANVACVLEDDHKERESAAENSGKVVVTTRAALAKAGLQGAKVRNQPRQEIKDWAIAQTATMRGAHKDIARILSKQLPEYFAGRSTDPERLIYDTLRKATKKD